jgi:peroxiredoxin
MKTAPDRAAEVSARHKIENDRPKVARAQTSKLNHRRLADTIDRQGQFKQAYRGTALPAGTPAPEFSLPSTPDQTVKLSELRGKPVVLAFYPADWSPVCGDQMALYNEMLSEFQELGAALLGISVDGAWCHAAFSRDRKLHFPLLADFEPKGAVARLYGVYRQREGVSERALFVINAEGDIHWSYLSPVGINPGAEGILNALEELQTNREPK